MSKFRRVSTIEAAARSDLAARQSSALHAARSSHGDIRNDEDISWCAFSAHFRNARRKIPGDGTTVVGERFIKHLVDRMSEWPGASERARERLCDGVLLHERREQGGDSVNGSEKSRSAY